MKFQSVNNENRLNENTITLEELTQDLANKSNDDQTTSELEKQQFESAVKLILERASKKFGSKMPASITIKTTTTSLTNQASPTPPSTSIDPGKPIFSDNKSTISNEPSLLGDTSKTPEYQFSSTPTQLNTPTMNALIDSFSGSTTGFMSLPQTAATSPATSSSSLMFLSTGQAKKQKKFRLEANEFNFNPFNNFNSIGTTSAAAAASINEEVLAKSEPKTNFQFDDQNKIQENTKSIMKETTHSYSESKQIDTSDNNSKIIRLPVVNNNCESNNFSKINNNSDSESNMSIYSEEGHKNRTKKRLNSTSSSISNLNDTNLSIYSVRQAPTLATGRRSKDVLLPPEEAKKRQERRERNKEAAARCRRKREDLTTNLTRQTEVLSRQQDGLKRKFQDLLTEKTRLEKILHSHEKVCQHLPSKNQKNHVNMNNNVINADDLVAQQQQQQHQQLIRIKKEDIDDIKKLSSEKVQQKLTTVNITGGCGNNTNSQATTSTKSYPPQASPSLYSNNIPSLTNTSHVGSSGVSASPGQFDKTNLLRSPVDSLNRLNLFNSKQVHHHQQQQQQQQSNKIFQIFSLLPAYLFLA